MERRLTAVFAADVVGYSRLMGEDEVGTLARLKACRRELVDPAIAEFHGRIIKLMGDGALVEFASVVDAVNCAVAIQRQMIDRETEVPEAKRIRFRIGINLGDVIVEDDDIYGDGVNIAARLEGLAEPGGICISGTAFDHAVHKVDVGFASLGVQRLKNIAEPVRAYRILLDPDEAKKTAPRTYIPSKRTMILASIGALLIGLAVVLAVLFDRQKPSTPERPSVAVLPFANLSGDPGQDYFSDGITDDLITDLSKLSGIDVIARNSVTGYKGRTVVLADVARELGVRYVVEGSVRRAGEQLRINAQLVDAASGKSIWTDRFDRRATDLFAIADDMRRALVQALGVEPSPTEARRLSRPPTADLEAYDYFLRAEQASRTGGREGLQEALALYEKAEALDPAFAEAFASDARTTAYIWRTHLNDIIQSAPARKRAYEKAGRALQLDPDLPSPYALLGVMQVIDRRYEEALASAKRAVALGPGVAEAYIALGYVQLFAGNHDEAAAAADTALRLDPNLPAFDRETAGLAFLLQGDTAKAVEALEHVCAEAPTVGSFRITLAAAYARADRLPEARAALAEGLRLLDASADQAAFRSASLSAWRITYAHLRKPEDLSWIVDSLRQAGMGEWPYGFTADDGDKLKAEQIAALVLGHTLHGHLEPGLQPAILHVGADGKAAFRSTTRMITETVYVDGNVLCEQSENMFGRPDCGPVYRRPAATGQPGYSYVNSGKVFHFSQVQ